MGDGLGRGQDKFEIDSDNIGDAVEVVVFLPDPHLAGNNRGSNGGMSW